MRTIARVAVAAIVLATCISWGAASSAGGGTILVVDRAFYEPGDRVVATALVWWRPNLGTPDDGPFGVWIRPEREWIPNASFATQIEYSRYVADLQIHDRGDGASIEQGSAAVRVEFVLPDVPPGHYSLMNCNYPCTTSFGDLTGGSFWVGPPPPPDPPPPTAAPVTAATAPVPAAATRLPSADEELRTASAAPRVTNRDEDGDGVMLFAAIGLVAAVGVAGTWRVLARRAARTR